MSLYYKRGRARPRPYPYDLIVNGLRVMLLGQDEDDTQMVSIKPPDQTNVVPTDYGEDARSPLWGRNHTTDTLHLGIGQRTAPKNGEANGRYRHAIGADPSVAGRPGMPGPDITTFTPGVLDAANPVNRFFDLGGALYWTNGRYLVRRDSDAASTAVQDLGASKIARDVAVFGPNSGTTTYAYIAMGDADNIWRYDGSTATQHASLKATSFCVRGTDLHRSLNTNQVSTVDTNSDPWTATNWAPANQYYIGDKSSAITRMVPHGSGSSGPGGTDFLLIYKTDGIYSINVAGEDQQFFPHMKFAPRTDNGECAGAFLNDQFVRMGETLWRIQPNMEGYPSGPELYGQLDPLLQGRVTAFAGHGSFHAYAGLYNHVDGDSYLMKYGAHVEQEDGTVGRIAAWHGSISQPFLDKRITALHKSTVGAPTDHARMYMGFSDGTIGWFTLPCVPDPAACDQYRWETEEGYVLLPDWHAGFRGNEKLLLSATVGGEDLDANSYARLAFAADGATTFTDAGSNLDITPRETVSFPGDIAATIVSFKLFVRSVVNTDAPKITSISIRWRLQTDLQQAYTWIIAAHDHLTARDGTRFRYGARRIREQIRSIIASAEVVPVVLMDEENKLMSLVDIQERTGWDGRAGRWQAGLQVTAVEEATTSVYGTYGRLNPLTYGDLNPLSYGDLSDL
jgi:hypothetical protein